MSVTHSNGNSKRVCVGVSVCVWNVTWHHIQPIRSVSPCRPKQFAFVMFVTPSGQSWNYRSLSLFYILRLQLQHQGGGWWRKCTGFMYRTPSPHPINTSGTYVRRRNCFFQQVFPGKTIPANIEPFDLLPRWDWKKRLTTRLRASCCWNKTGALRLVGNRKATSSRDRREAPSPRAEVALWREQQMSEMMKVTR